MMGVIICAREQGAVVIKGKRKLFFENKKISHCMTWYMTSSINGIMTDNESIIKKG